MRSPRLRPAFLRRLLLAVLVLALGLPSANFAAYGSLAAPAAQDSTPQQSAQQLLNSLTPAERVGQLFLVTFNGPSADSTTQVYDLIVRRHVGGVILMNANDNFLAPDQTALGAINLIRQLQLDEYNGSREAQNEPDTGNTFDPAFIPLFIGIIQDGDGYPYDQILNGVTPLPNAMALGATWQPALAQRVGNTLGKELSSLGFNLLLGPSLDVVESPYNETNGDLGVNTFGGDPFWVGEMGRSFISGLHTGSGGRLAVVAKHFPGLGGADRLPEEEVATVRKSLEQLKQIELAPFFAVTGNAPAPETILDGLLTSHIRYQGFQGNIHTTTKPISFDAKAFAELMGLPQFSSWHANGGVMISDELGSRAVRRFYDPTGQTFNSHFVARDAFLAGNDLLYLGNFIASDDTDAYTSIVRTLDFFTQKYRQDDSFAQRVDESVLRILTLKYRLYNNDFNLNDTLPAQEAADQVGNANQVVLEVVRQSCTLISPSLADLANTLPEPPQRNERIVFITDVRSYQQCSRCPTQYVLAKDALEMAVTRLYSRGGQVLPANLVSYSFKELQDHLNGTAINSDLENDLRSAPWIVFSMLDVNPNIPSSQALRQFLSRRPDLIPQKKLVVFAFNAPYYLDATDVSKLTAYYGLYSRSPQFVDTAARLLFQELRPSGNLPVSVPGVGYDLNQITFPNPTQTIPLTLDLPTPVENEGATSTPSTPTVAPVFRTSDIIPVTTGVIVDNNGHPVPDGTVVRFIITHQGEPVFTQQIENQTTQGVAKATLRVEIAGRWEIRAESEEALQSDIITLDISPALAGTALPSETPSPTASPSPTATPVPTRTPSPSATPLITVTPTPPPPLHTNFGDWLMAILIAAGIGVAHYTLARALGQMRWGVRGAFLAWIGGLLAYFYLALNLPGSEALLRRTGLWGVILLALLGAGLGAGITWLWRSLATWQNTRRA